MAYKGLGAQQGNGDAGEAVGHHAGGGQQVQGGHGLTSHGSLAPLCIMWGQPDKAEEAREAASPTPKPTPHPVLCAALIIAPNLPQSGMITQ